MAQDGLSFRSFVSETELDEKRKKRQEEWEKVRTADQPLECPEEEVDTRSLYDKLQEHKDKQQTDYEEQFKFKNMVRGIDEDESKFLDQVADRRTEIETQRLREEKDLLNEMKQYTERVIPVDETKPTSASMVNHTEKPTTAKTAGAASGRKTQASLLAGVVKRKRSDPEDTNEKKIKTTSSTNSESQAASDVHQGTTTSNKSDIEPANATAKASLSDTVDRPLESENDKAQVIGILPGLGFYSNSSDSDTSTSDSEVDLINLGINRPKKKINSPHK